MDYKEKYTREDALRDLQGFIGQLTEGCQKAIKTLIPELSESEDERIRKWIFNLVENLGSPADEDAEKELEEMQPLALAWLEKQKEKEQRPRGAEAHRVER